MPQQSVSCCLCVVFLLLYFDLDHQFFVENCISIYWIRQAPVITVEVYISLLMLNCLEGFRAIICQIKFFMHRFWVHRSRTEGLFVFVCLFVYLQNFFSLQILSYTLNSTYKNNSFSTLKNYCLFTTAVSLRSS